jgi:thiamine biosynthesis lipoprotein
VTTLVHDENVMGTVVSFRVDHDRAGHRAAREAVASVCAVLHHIDATFSTWKPGSPMSRLRRGELEQPPPEIERVLDLCRQAKQLSGGWFDPWAMPGGVDPTGLVKGWAAEEAVANLAVAGVRSVILNAAGDVAVLAETERIWRLGVRHPWRADALACIVETTVPVATSGTYERPSQLVVPEAMAGRVDPRRRPVSATVTGASLALADALATALCVGGAEVLAMIDAADGFEGYLIFDDGGEAWTPRFPFAC